MTVVISHVDGTPALLAENQLEDGFNASAAIAGDELFLRGEKYLYCIARPAGEAVEKAGSKNAASKETKKTGR